jgi:hypothetical protein
MNEDINRNTRTLILSFVIAIMVLIPLRFVEVGQLLTNTDVQVLGETVTNQEVVVEPTVGLEEPYNTIENGQDCIQRADIDAAWSDLKSEVENKQIDENQATEMTKNLILAEEKVCK